MRTKLNKSQMKWFNQDGKRFCNWANCPNRFKVFKRVNMIEYMNLYFCSEKCLNEYKQANPTDKELLKW